MPNKNTTNQYYVPDITKMNDDKTSICHFIYFDGEDIDISNKKVLECYEQKSNIVLIKKFSKSKKLVFFEEQFLYILSDLKVNKDNENIRRLSKKYDLCRLCEIEAKEENNKFLFILKFIRNDYFDKISKYLIFEQDEGNTFYDYLSDALDRCESTFFGDFSDDEEEEEDDDEENKDGVDESVNDVDMSNRQMNSIHFEKNTDLISTSRKKIL